MIYFIKNHIFPNIRISLRPRIYMNLCFFKYLYFYTKQADLQTLQHSSQSMHGHSHTVRDCLKKNKKISFFDKFLLTNNSSCGILFPTGG